MTERAEVSRAALGIMGTRVGVYPFRIIVSLIVAPMLGTTNYGVYAFLLLPGTVALPLMTFGFTLGVRYYISSEEYRAKDVSFMALVVGLLNGLMTALLFGFLWEYDLLGETGRAITFDLLLPILVILPLQGATLSMNKVMAGASWFSAMNLMILLTNISPPAFLLLFVIIAGLGLAGAVGAIVASNLVLAIIAIVMVFRRFKPRVRFEKAFLNKAGHYGLKSWIGALANRTSVRFDQFVLGYVQAPEALGVYRIAVMIAELLWIIPDAISIPLFNRVSRTKLLKDRVSVVMQSNRVLILAVALLGIAIFVPCWWAVPLVLGQEYIDARWLLGILLPGAVSLVTSRIVGMYFTASGEPEKASVIEVVGAVVSLIGYLTLIPWLGLSGAALATSGSYIVIAVTAGIMFSRAIRPIPSRLYRATGADIRWAAELVKDSFSIWKSRLRGVT